MKDKDGRFTDRYGDFTDLGWLIAIISIFLIASGVIMGTIAGLNIAYSEGIQTTVTGSIQLHQLKYSRFWNLEYTDVEMRTYSGDTHHLTLKGHVDLEYGSTYTITFECQNYWAHLKLVDKPVNITKIPNPNGGEL